MNRRNPCQSQIESLLVLIKREHQNGNDGQCRSRHEKRHDRREISYHPMANRQENLRLECRNREAQSQPRSPKNTSHKRAKKGVLMSSPIFKLIGSPLCGIL